MNTFPPTPQRVSKNQWLPLGFPAFSGPDPSKLNYGLPTNRALLTTDPATGQLVDAGMLAMRGQSLGGGGSFGMGKPDGGGGGGGRSPMQPANNPFAPDPNYDPTGTPFAPDKRKPGQFAGGGMVTGPGGPKDDMIPAKLSAGEFVMPAETVRYFGLDKLHKMTQKAKEGLMEIPEGTPQAPPTAPLHMAEGGVVPAAGAFGSSAAANSNPSFLDYLTPWRGWKADDVAHASLTPALAEMDQFLSSQRAQTAADYQRAADRNAEIARLDDPAYVASLAAAPIPSGSPMPVSKDARRSARAPAAAPIPSGSPMPATTLPVSMPVSPPSSIPAIAMPGDRANPPPFMVPPGRQPPLFPSPSPSASSSPSLSPTHEDMRFKGLAARAAIDNAHPSAPSTFQAPWERDAAARSARDASLIPGMNHTQTRRFLQSPQGATAMLNKQQHQQDRQSEDARVAEDRRFTLQRDATAATERADREAVANNFRLKEANDQWSRWQIEEQQKQQQQNQPWVQIPGTRYVAGPKGQALPMAQEPQPIPPGMVPDSMTVGGVRYKTPAPDKAAATPGIHATKQIDGVNYNMSKTGELTRAPIKDPTPQVKAQIFKHVNGRDPVSESDWTEAHYLTTGDARSAAPSQPGTGNREPGTLKAFTATTTTTKAEIAALPPGTPIRMPDGSVKYKK